LKWLGQLGDGRSDFTVGYSLDHVAGSTALAQTLTVDSPLSGTSLDLPAPLNKPEAASLPLHLSMSLPVSGSDLQLTLGQLARGTFTVGGRSRSNRWQPRWHLAISCPKACPRGICAFAVMQVSWMSPAGCSMPRPAPVAVAGTGESGCQHGSGRMVRSFAGADEDPAQTASGRVERGRGWRRDGRHIRLCPLIWTSAALPHGCSGCTGPKIPRRRQQRRRMRRRRTPPTPVSIPRRCHRFISTWRTCDWATRSWVRPAWKPGRPRGHAYRAAARVVQQRADHRQRRLERQPQQQPYATEDSVCSRRSRHDAGCIRFRRHGQWRQDQRRARCQLARPAQRAIAGQHGWHAQYSRQQRAYSRSDNSHEGATARVGFADRIATPALSGFWRCLRQGSRVRFDHRRFSSCRWQRHDDQPVHEGTSREHQHHRPHRSACQGFRSAGAGNAACG
jgi:hypothetical protein